MQFINRDIKQIIIPVNYSYFLESQGGVTFLLHLIDWLKIRTKLPILIISDLSKSELRSDKFIKKYMQYRQKCTVVNTNITYATKNTDVVIFPDEYIFFKYNKYKSLTINYILCLSAYTWQANRFCTERLQHMYSSEDEGLTPIDRGALYKEFMGKFEFIDKCIMISLNIYNNIEIAKVNPNIRTVGTYCSANYIQNKNQHGIAIASNCFYTKGTALTLDILKDSGIPITVYGNNDMLRTKKPEFENLATYKHIPQHTVCEALASHKMLVMLSKLDTLPNVILDAAPNIKCLVSSDVSWHKHINVPVTAVNDCATDIIREYENYKNFTALNINEHNKQVYLSWEKAFNEIIKTS